MGALKNVGAEQRSAQRNLHPHKAAVAAMWLWGARYSRQRGGSMDFWDSLTPSEKRTARDLANQIVRAPDENYYPKG